jgi:hypothetical protein
MGPSPEWRRGQTPLGHGGPTPFRNGSVADGSVDPFSQKVCVTTVAGVFLDHVHGDVAQVHWMAAKLALYDFSE